MNPSRWFHRNDLPQNSRARDAAKTALEKDAAYALKTVRGYMEHLPGGDPSWLRGKNVLEIGPGIHYGVPLILACCGARVAVADRFPPAWQPAYHPAFYALLLKKLAGEFPGIDPRPLEAILKDRAALADHVAELRAPLEHFPRSLRNRYDVVFSNAVLEHLFLPLRAIRRLALVTRPGGLGFHQVDFRDHRDFTRPLEYLLLNRIQFWKVFYWSHAECGNRLRPEEFSRRFARAGFAVAHFAINMAADGLYLERFIPKLRLAPSVYAQWPAAGLKTLSGRFHLVKT
ncbi:MAG TPA: methyltransferase domain-containing protein [Acidobacteriota bacterium]